MTPEERKERNRFLGYRRSAIHSIELFEYHLYRDALSYIKKPNEELKAKLIKATDVIINQKDRLTKLNQKLGISK